ncbi:hypothetical protein D3C75_1135920 [compost metagenome]
MVAWQLVKHTLSDRSPTAQLALSQFDHSLLERWSVARPQALDTFTQRRTDSSHPIFKQTPLAIPRWVARRPQPQLQRRRDFESTCS